MLLVTADCNTHLWWHGTVDIFFILLPILLDLTYFYLAAVLLKQFIKKHWLEGEELFEHPAVSSDEKVYLTIETT